MKRLITLALLILTIGLIGRASAQVQVQVTLTIPELGSPYLSDYIGYEGNRVLTLTNTTARQQTITLHGSLEQLNAPGYYFRTRENYRPAAPIVLGPNETRTLFARSSDWDFIQERHLEDNVSTRVRQQVAASGVLPEGEYQICVQAFDFNSGRPLSPEAPGGCQFFVASLGSPPQIVQPADRDSLTQEFPAITWTPAIILQGQTQLRYDLYVAELTSRALNPQEVMEQSIQYRGGNPFVVENLSQTFYQFLPGDPPLKPGSRYAIFVVAKDNRGSAVFENQGRSEIVIVTAGSDEAAPSGGRTTGQEIAIADPEIIQMLPTSHLQGRLLYRFFEDGQGPYAITGVATINDTFEPETLMSLQSGNSLQNQGYQHGSERPESVDDTGAGETSTDMSMASFENHFFGSPPPPQYMLPPGYHTHGGKPLRQAAIRFTARYAVGKQSIIRHPDDLIYLGGTGVSTVTGGMFAESLTIQTEPKVVAATTTDDDGHYNVFFPADETFGMLTGGPVTINHGWAGDIHLGSQTGYGLYRVITMEVEEKWYAHPDVVVFMQPGQSLEVPDQVVTVQSYNLQVQVRAAPKQYEQLASDGGPIIGAVVKLGRAKTVHENAPASFPKDEVNVEEFPGKSIGSPYSNHMLADSAMTGASGNVTFRRLVKHHGSYGCQDFIVDEYIGWPSDGYYVEAETHPTLTSFNYSKNRESNLAPCPARLKNADFKPRSADYTPSTITQELELSPRWPKLYVQSLGEYDGFIGNLPNTNLMLFAFDGDDQFIGSMTAETDHNGLFTKQFLAPTDIHAGLLRTDPDLLPSMYGGVSSKYVLAFWKSGFTSLPCQDCGSLGLFGGEFKPQELQMGQVWDVDVQLLPGAVVKGRIEDEHGQPIYGQVKISDGPWLDFSPEWGWSQQEEEPLFQLAPEWMQQFGSVQQQSSSGLQQGDFQMQTQGQQNQNQQSGIQAQEPVQRIGSTRYQGGFEVEYQSGILVNPNISKVSEFETRAQYGEQIPIFIRPDASNYFDEEVFYVDIPPPSGYEGPVYDLGTFVISERLKRPRVFVYWEELPIIDPNTLQVTDYMKAPVEGAEVQISNRPPTTTNAEGIAEPGIFGSPSDEFRIRVNKEGHIPVDQYVTIPATKKDDPTLIEVHLLPGKTLTGTVTRADTGDPIEGARVYTEVDHNKYGPVLIETLTGSDGKYQLEGLPDWVTVWAAKTDDPSVTYIGQSKQFNPQTLTLEFELEEAPFLMTTIWNLPVDLEEVAPSGDHWSISGAFVNLPPNERFTPENESQRLPFSNLMVQMVGSPGPNGKVSVEPAASSIKTTTNAFRSVLNDAHIVEMKGPNAGIMYAVFNEPGETSTIPSPTQGELSRIEIEKDGDGNGHVKVRAYTGLEYMSYTYKYDGQFYLSENQQNTQISAYRGAGASEEPDMPEIYSLMPDDKPWGVQITVATVPDYHVHGFPAVIDPYESYVYADTFAIATKLIVDLPLSNPEKLFVSAGHIYVTPEKIIVNTGDQPLEFDLETWHVKTGPWEFDPEQGGIVTSGFIRTDLLELPAPHILIKPNNLRLPVASQIGLQGITFGGVLDVDIHPNAKLKFDYTTSNKNHPNVPHWRVQLARPDQNEPVASIRDLPGWPAQTTVGIDFIENYSGPVGEMENRLYLTMAQGQVVDHYRVIKQTVSKLYLYEDGVVFAGNTDLEIPNLSPGHTALFVYYREHGEVKMRVQGLVTRFETTGKVEFQGDQPFDRITLDWDHFEVTGDLKIYEDEFTAVKRPDDKWLRAKLIKKPGDSSTCVSASTNQTSDICIEIIDVDGGGQLEGGNQQAIALGGGQEGLKRLLVGSQHVTGNMWNELTYHAQFEGFGGNSFDGQDTMWFVVKGAIENDATKGDEIELANIDTPFGDFNLIFDIEEQAIDGHLEIGFPISMGVVQLLPGSGFNLRMGGLGFYIAATTKGIYPVIGTLNVNFIVGYYPQLTPLAKSMLLKNMYIQKLPGFLENSGIQGLYFTANYPFFNEELGPIIIPIPPASIELGVYAYAGIDARFWLNFGDQYGGGYLGGLAYGKAGLTANIQALPGVNACTACIGILAELGFEAAFQWQPESSFSVSACGAVGLAAQLCGHGISETARLDIGWGTNEGFDIGVSLGGTCSGNAEQSGGLSCVE